MFKKILVTAVIGLLQPVILLATHLRSGEIHVKQENKGSLTVTITVIVYTNTINTNVLFGGDDDILDFGDGSDPDGDGRLGIMVPETENILRPDLGPGIAMASFTVSHTYPAFSNYLISYSEPNRNESILNMDGSVNTRFYTETFIVLKADAQYQTPEFLTPPVFITAFQYPFTRSLACIDTVNQLIYDLAIPMRERNQLVTNYKLPKNFVINPFNGELIWDMSNQEDPIFAAGEFAFAVKVTQVNNNEVVGYIVRDFQIIVHEEEGAGKVVDDPRTDENGRIYVSEGDGYSAKIIASDFNPENIEISLYSEDAATSALSLDTYDSTGTDGAAIKVILLNVTNLASLARALPYPITVRVSLGDYSTSDLNYLFYTEDIQPEIPEILQPPPPPPTPVGIEDPAGLQAGAYPNPFSTRLNLDIALKGEAILEICNMQGQVIKSLSLSSSEVDLSDLISGEYILIVRQKDGISFVKAVKH